MEDSEKDISRRSALKRIGAAGAIAWATPVIASMNTPAFARASGPCGVPPCGSACGEPFVWCHAQDCICVLTTEGGCACVQFNVGAPPGNCTSSAECGAGAVCVAHTCLGSYCQPQCGVAGGQAVTGLNSR